MDPVGNILGTNYDDEIDSLYEDLKYAEIRGDKSGIRRIRKRILGLR